MRFLANFGLFLPFPFSVGASHDQYFLTLFNGKWTVFLVFQVVVSVVVNTTPQSNVFLEHALTNYISLDIIAVYLYASMHVLIHC